MRLAATQPRPGLCVCAMRALTDLPARAVQSRTRGAARSGISAAELEAILDRDAVVKVGSSMATSATAAPAGGGAGGGAGAASAAASRGGAVRNSGKSGKLQHSGAGYQFVHAAHASALLDSLTT